MVNFKNLTVSVLDGTSKNRAKYVLAPLPKGYGATLGNSLRRVLLSSIQGAALYQAKIKGATHQFSTLEGVKEDVVDILLNLKQIRLLMEVDTPQVITLKASKAGVITAADLDLPSGVKVVNPEQVIATLNKGAALEMELLAQKGFGYVFSEEQEVNKVGVLPLDALYSPIVRVSWEVSETRVGTRSDLDKLVLDIQTDGTISPKDSLMEAAAILRDFFSKVGEDVEAPISQLEPEQATVLKTVEQPESDSKNNVSLEEIAAIPSRTVNALKKAKINTVKDVMERDWDELLAVKNLGKKSVEGLKEILEAEGYKFEK